MEKGVSGLRGFDVLRSRMAAFRACHGPYRDCIFAAVGRTGCSGCLRLQALAKELLRSFGQRVEGASFKGLG